MNAGLQAFAAYRETNAATAIMDASPHQLTALLFKALLDKLAIAEGAIGRGDVPSKCDSISKANNILMELKSTLDLTNGGQIADELDRLYEFSISGLLDANLQDSVEKIRSVRAVMSEVNEAWIQIAPARGDG